MKIGDYVTNLSFLPSTYLFPSPSTSIAASAGFPHFFPCFPSFPPCVLSFLPCPSASFPYLLHPFLLFLLSAVFPPSSPAFFLPFILCFPSSFALLHFFFPSLLSSLAFLRFPPFVPASSGWSRHFHDRSIRRGFLLCLLGGWSRARPVQEQRWRLLRMGVCRRRLLHRQDSRWSRHLWKRHENHPPPQGGHDGELHTVLKKID